jgi:hypothetical protein
LIARCGTKPRLPAPRFFVDVRAAWRSLFDDLLAARARPVLARALGLRLGSARDIAPATALRLLLAESTLVTLDPLVLRCVLARLAWRRLAGTLRLGPIVFRGLSLRRFIGNLLR